MIATLKTVIPVATRRTSRGNVRLDQKSFISTKVRTPTCGSHIVPFTALVDQKSSIRKLVDPNSSKPREVLRVVVFVSVATLVLVVVGPNSAPLAAIELRPRGGVVSHS